MASSISALSALNPAAANNGVKPAASQATSPMKSVDSKTQLQAMEKQGNFQAYLNNSMAAALFQPSSASDGSTSMTTLVNNMLQQVLGAYKSQSG